MRRRAEFGPSDLEKADIVHFSVGALCKLLASRPTIRKEPRAKIVRETERNSSKRASKGKREKVKGKIYTLTYCLLPTTIR